MMTPTSNVSIILKPLIGEIVCFVTMHHLEEFTEEIEDQYDLIISNPPFYTEAYKTENEIAKSARFEDAMPFQRTSKIRFQVTITNWTF